MSTDDHGRGIIGLYIYAGDQTNRLPDLKMLPYGCSVK